MTKLFLSLGISIGSIIIGIVIILLFGDGNGLVGSGWILSILGAPLTFLSILLYKFYQNFLNNFITVFILYLFQYQILAFLLYKFYNRLTMILLLSVIIIISSAYLMWYICVGKYSPKSNHPVYGSSYQRFLD